MRLLQRSSKSPAACSVNWASLDMGIYALQWVRGQNSVGKTKIRWLLFGRLWNVAVLRLSDCST